MYNPYFAGYPSPTPVNNFIQQPLQKQEVVRVNGKNGAEAYQMAPDSSVLLLDTTAPLIWLVQTDGAGYKTVSPYSISPYQTKEETQVVELSSLEARISKIEEELKEYDAKQQSNNANVGKNTVSKSSK